MYIKELKIGERIGTRTVIELLPDRKNGYLRYIVKCDCGNISTVSGSYFRLKKPKCRNCSLKTSNKKGKNHYAYKHGMASRLEGKNSVYSSWVSMRQRCRDPNDVQFKDYGARGIKVCNEWEYFKNFYQDMGDRPNGTQLDRIDVNGNYFKENCRWADIITQANNKRNTVYYEIDGKKISQRDLREKLGWSVSKLRRQKEKYGKDKIIKDYKDLPPD